MQEFDVNWESRPGFATRPWTPAHHLVDLVVKDVLVKNVANDKGFYFPLASTVDYLKGKKSAGAVVDPAYPQGYWFKSLLLQNIAVDGVRRIDNDKIQSAHTDGLYLVDAPGDGSKIDVTVEDFKLRNCDGSCMAVLIQNPGRYGTLTFRRLDWDDTVAQRRVVIKTGVTIDVLRLEDTPHPFTINAPEGNGRVTRIEVRNCPKVSLKAFKKLDTEIVYLDDVAAPVPLPSPSLPIPRKPVAVYVEFSDGTRELFK